MIREAVAAGCSRAPRTRQNWCKLVATEERRPGREFGFTLFAFPTSGRHSTSRNIRSSYSAPDIGPSLSRNRRVASAIECVSTAFPSFQISTTVK